MAAINHTVIRIHSFCLETGWVCVFVWSVSVCRTRVHVFLFQSWNEPPVVCVCWGGQFCFTALDCFLIRKVEDCTISPRPKLNEFILLCGQQRHAPLWEKAPEQLTVSFPQTVLHEEPHPMFGRDLNCFTTIITYFSRTFSFTNVVIIGCGHFLTDSCLLLFHKCAPGTVYYISSWAKSQSNMKLVETQKGDRTAVLKAMVHHTPFGYY